MSCKSPNGIVTKDRSPYTIMLRDMDHDGWKSAISQMHTIRAYSLSILIMDIGHFFNASISFFYFYFNYHFPF